VLTNSEFVAIKDAVKSESGCTVLEFHVNSGSSRSGFAGYDQWRKCIKVSIKSQPKKGEANAELISLISKWFGIEESMVEIVSGNKDRSKRVSIRGLDEGKVLEVLEGMEEGA
jgi:uncharacterized protein (TIGR00251 family)